MIEMQKYLAKVQNENGTNREVQVYATDTADARKQLEKMDGVQRVIYIVPEELAR